jgi:hypothetical protein
VTQTQRDPKTTGQSGGYWVEAGYGTWTNGGNTTSDYFWADNRPNFGSVSCNKSPGSFVAHMLGPVSSVTVAYTITQDTANNNNEYDVSITDTSGAVKYVPDHQTKDQISTCNPMAPQEADAGLEFYGIPSYVAAGNATFDSYSLATPSGTPSASAQGYFTQSPANLTPNSGNTSGVTQCGC